MSAARPRHGRMSFGALPIVLSGCAIFLGMLALFWIGTRGSDDSLYWRASSEWLRSAPFIGSDHWALRYTLVIPLALSRLLLGDGPLALALPSILAALSLVTLATVWVFSVAGRLAAWIVACLLATCPILVFLSSTADIDFIEAAFVLASFVILHRSMTGRPFWPNLFLGGVLLGLGLLSRETTVFAAVAIGLLFLAGYGMPRRCYIVFAAGSGCVVAGEALLFWLTTGDPLYRLTISLHHDSTINRWVEQGSAVPAIHPLIDPFTMLLFNHQFGGAFLIGVPALIVYLFRNGLSGRTRRLVVLVLCVSATWAFLAAALWNQLALVARYYTLPLIGTLILVSVVLGHQREMKRTWAPLIIAALMLSGNLVACMLDNRSFMFGEQTLVALAEQEPGVIHTDDQTLRRAELLLAWRHLGDHVADTPPEAGNLFFYNPPRAAEASVSPAPDWTILERMAPPPSLSQTVLHALPIPLPAFLERKLGRRQPETVLYRVK